MMKKKLKTHSPYSLNQSMKDGDYVRGDMYIYINKI